MVSTFSGAGGSCLGFEMAGFQVDWANEFDAFGAESYSLNHPSTILDRRDIREVLAGDVLDELGLQSGELDLLEGSPPCSKFSTAGLRAKSWGKVTGSDSKIKQRNVEDLFFEFIRLLSGLKPKMVVAENVTGLDRGVAKGYLKDIIKAIRLSGYRVKVGKLDAQWLGVPQRRRRLIFVGVRSDLKGEFLFPSPLPYRYSVADACPWLIEDQAPYEMRSLSISELKRIFSFPDDAHLVGPKGQQWVRLGNSVPPMMAKAIADQIKRTLDLLE